MATAVELLVLVEAALDEIEADLGLPTGANVPTAPLPTLKQMMVALEPRLRAIAAAVPAGGVVSPPEGPPVVDLKAVLDGLAVDVARANALAAESLGKMVDLLTRVTPPPAPEPPPESADGTESPPATRIVDAQGMTWDLVRPYDLIVYKAHQVHVRDGAAWFAWSNGAWVPSSDPRGAAPPPPPPPATNRDPQITQQPVSPAPFVQGQAGVRSVPYKAADPDGDALFAKLTGALPAGVRVKGVSSVAVDLEYDGSGGAGAGDVRLEVSDGRG